MSEKAFPMKKMIPVIVITWILSLVSTLAIVYFAPSIFPPIKTGNISDEAIITTKLADGSVTSSKILNGTITAADMSDGSIISVKVADGAVTTTKIADGAVTTAKIADGAILTTKLADGSVTSAKILDGAITAADLATGSVSTINIADGAVTTTKIADYAVTNLKLAPYAIPFASTYSALYNETNSTAWVDMPGMAVSLTFDRVSNIVIMFSTEAVTQYVPTGLSQIAIQALVVDGTAFGTGFAAFPGPVYLTSSELNTLTFTSYSYNFNIPRLINGTYTIKMQWMVTAGTCKVWRRSLTVIAFPA